MFLLGRFNNYMEAIYRRMNAAIYAKNFDPMVLNLGLRHRKNVRVKRYQAKINCLDFYQL